jgi:hypothetical protein
MGGNVSGCPRRLQRGGGCPSTSSAPRGRSRRRPGDTRLSSKATGPQSVGCCQGPTLDCPPSEAPDKPQLSVVFSSSSPDLTRLFLFFKFLFLIGNSSEGVISSIAARQSPPRANHQSPPRANH